MYRGEIYYKTSKDYKRLHDLILKGYVIIYFYNDNKDDSTVMNVDILKYHKRTFVIKTAHGFMMNGLETLENYCKKYKVEFIEPN